MGYAPDFTATEPCCKEIFTQVVDFKDFDLNRVILAVNNIPVSR